MVSNCKVTVFILFMILLGSCKKNVEREASQPTILEKNSGFNFSKIDFNENVLELVSKSLDTNETGFKGKNYEVFKFKNDFKEGELPIQYFSMQDDRYYFQTVTVDSIARFNDLNFYKVSIETDKNKNLLACIGNCKFKEKKELDKKLLTILKKLGNTTDELAEIDEQQKRIDTLKANGRTDEELKFLGYTIDKTRKFKELLDYGENSYFLWKSEDRYIQISFSKDREISVSTIAEDNYNIEYWYVTFLVIKKEEYEKIEKLQFDRAVKLQQEGRVLKPYELYDLNMSSNWRYNQKIRKAWN